MHRDNNTKITGRLPITAPSLPRQEYVPIRDSGGLRATLPGLNGPHQEPKSLAGYPRLEFHIGGFSIFLFLILVKMGFPETPRRNRDRLVLRGMGFLLLGSAFFLQAILWGAVTLAPFRTSEVSASAIESPKTPETCPHHSQGCPKDCMCPKTHMGSEEPSEPVKRMGVITEPALVACTEHGPKPLIATFDFCLLEESWRIRIPESISLHGAAKLDPLQDWFREPPPKIPIA